MTAFLVILAMLALGLTCALGWLDGLDKDNDL